MRCDNAPKAKTKQNKQKQEEAKTKQDKTKQDKTQTSEANAQTIRICHVYRLHSHPPYLINHHEHLSCFTQFYNRITAQVLVFL